MSMSSASRIVTDCGAQAMSTDSPSASIAVIVDVFPEGGR